jgi:hypothetical protein
VQAPDVADSCQGAIVPDPPDDVGTEELAAVPELPALLPGLLHLQHEAGGRRVEPLTRNLPRHRVTGETQRDDIPDPPRLQPPGRHREIAEDLRGEQPRRRLSGLPEHDELARDHLDTVGHHRGHDLTSACCSMFAPTTAIVDCRAGGGLNSTTSVPVYGWGTWPGEM